MAGALAACLAQPSFAAGDRLWDTFERRCLLPYEHLLTPDMRGLTDANGAWSDGSGLRVITTESTCAVTGAATASLSARLMGRSDGRRYAEVRAGVWQSDRWREPRIEVEALADGYLVRETDLEG
ncbi:hypothetical protein JANAI62_32860 [Jannaschia pagri]|uniref:Uncharacterized protein n=1 Tax=Jannaschia pagri TaxID=2829797 RepID=A0ABQ4NQL3_9RHOB|nr:hypothetical protein JANAI61_32860 [Jannaschia sp. AI_61]GIT96663.1 hypothetical protein JANAI62_32860 [Jannaschia sp. AI_62]